MSGAAEGHDSGHESLPGCTWGRYVELLVLELGGFTSLADRLVHAGRGRVELPTDRLTVEKGLRRLAKRGHEAGGQYGRWLVLLFGVPRPLERAARWMGQYHSRFSDLPSSVREAQLVLHDRPPLSASRAAAWIHAGLAGVALGRRELDEVDERLKRARLALLRGAEGGVEVELLEARVRIGERRHELLRAARAGLDGGLEPADRACYHARWVDQVAYDLTHRAEPRFAEALLAYESIPLDTDLPFVDFRRAHGRAYCLARLGDSLGALGEARSAAEHAGDGGFVRLRALALAQLARLLPDDEAAPIRSRARRLAAQLEDEDLLSRVGRSASAAGG